MSKHDQPSPGPLAGIRVLDFTALLQGPLATQILGDLGADVVKLEKQGGEWMRQWGIFMSRTHGETDAFLAFNRNKRSVEIDLRNAEDLERVLQLVDRADVVIENFRPGVMDRLGLGYEALRQRNPRLIYAASSGYGRTGPYVTRPGQDYLVQALTGATWLTGRRDDPPFLMAPAVADQYTGLHLVVGILAALQHRQRTGEGQRVDVDLLSCMLALQQQELTVFFNHGARMERPRENIGHPGLTAPCGIYATRDGYMILAMFPCPKLGEVLGLAWLGEYDTNEKMLEFRDDIYRRLSEHFAAESTAHWIELLSSHDVWCAPVQKYEDLERDPQVAHKKLIWDVPCADGGATYRTVGSPFSFSASPVSVRRGAPGSGQDNAAFRKGDIWKE
ncbi:MAG: CoA transferase [Gammaproteobacteria bacterium]|nr:CoA transferase [Gammaproteobacteria bacterium]